MIISLLQCKFETVIEGVRVAYTLRKIEQGGRLQIFTVISFRHFSASPPEKPGSFLRVTTAK